jgi:dephospho-CoA kinase
MSFEESWKYDFRIEALVHMLKRLEELTAALNLPISAYSRKSASAVTSQLSLLDSKRKVFVVVGRTCAGKTTMCERLSAAHGFTVFEASAVLRSIAESAGVAREANITEQQFAASVLDQFGADAVARKIAEFLDGTHVDKLAISGFRTIEELESIRGHFPETQIILVEASERTRFERRIRRGRADETLTFEQFNKLDQSQWQLGLLRVAEQLADLRVVNEIDIETYYRAVDSLAGSSAIPFGQVIHRVTAANLDFESNQLARCLEVLEQAARPLDCGEIEERTAALGARIRHNNANKVLKAAPELAVRLEMQGSRVRYRIGSAGYAFLRLLRHRDEAQKRTATSPT